MISDERARRIADGELDLSIFDGQLVLTFAAERLNVCQECPYLHVVFLEVASATNIRKLAAGIAHLAEHLE